MQRFCNKVKYFERKDETNKCNRIFRPWDVDSGAQDATVSTTTEVEEHQVISTEETCDKKVEELATKSLFKPLLKEDLSLPKSPVDPLNYSEYQVEKNPVYNTDIFQTNLANSLGLSTVDPVLLETMAGGCTFEDYTRFLSQEHQAKILNSRKQRPKKHKCPHCDVGFSNNGQLKGHIRIHTGERPFKCDEKDCGKTFTRNEELTRHKRIHSGLRPFPCTHCGKRFGRKDHLKKHSRTHFQPRGMYAVPVMLPFEAWATPAVGYPYMPMFGY